MHPMSPAVVRRALLLLCLVAPVALAKQASPPPELRDLDAYVESVRDAFDVPGIAVAVVKDGEVVLARGWGEREMGKPAQVDAHTMFAIASNTKAFTAASLSMLADEGKLKLHLFSIVLMQLMPN